MGQFTLTNWWFSDLPADFRDKIFNLKPEPSAAETPAENAEPEGQKTEAQNPESTSAKAAETPGEMQSAEQKETAQSEQPPATPTETAEGAVPSETPSAVAAAPEKLLEIGHARVEVGLGIPSELAFYREIDLPFRDIKKITQVIRLEADGYFPFELDNYLVEFVPPSGSGEASQVLTFVLDKTRYSTILAQLKSFNFDPAFTGIEGLTLPLLAMNDGPGLRLWFEMGAKRTILVASAGADPFLYRRIPTGLNDLVARVAGELGVAEDKAEQIIFETDISADSESAAAKAIRSWLNLLVSPVAETMHWFERNRKGAELTPQFEQMVLCGGGANILGLDKFFTSELNIPSARFRLPAWVAKAEGVTVGEDKEPLLAEALSLALARLAKSGRTQINFRKGEFVYRAQYTIAYRRVAFPAILLLVMMVLGIAKAGTQYSLVNKQSKQIENDIRNRYTEIFPGAKPADPVQQIKQTYAVETKRLAASTDLFYPTATECLAAVGDQIPKEITYQLSKFSYSGNKVRIEGETNEFASTKSIVDRLGKVEFFKEVKLDDSRSAPNGKVTFVISIELKNPAEAKHE